MFGRNLFVVVGKSKGELPGGGGEGRRGGRWGGAGRALSRSVCFNLEKVIRDTEVFCLQLEGDPEGKLSLLLFSLLPCLFFSFFSTVLFHLHNLPLPFQSYEKSPSVPRTWWHTMAPSGGSLRI